MSLWNRSHKTRSIRSPHRRMQTMFNLIQGTSFCIWQKGSYTIEAAVVIPLLSMYLVILLFFFPILRIQCVVDEALLYAGRKTAVESSVIESEELLFLSAEAYLLYALQDNTLIEKYVKDGMWGIRLWKSDFIGEEIVLRADYTIKLPFSLGEIGEISLTSQNCFRKWTRGNTAQKTGEYVYVTKHSEVYHASLTCRSIQLSVRVGSIDSISGLRGKDGQRYYECNRCDWEDSKKERIYYTDYGSLYHKSIACSAIKRVVEKIKLEEVKDRRPCSFCCEG